MKSLDLSTRAKFRLSGADRVRYLNGQVSNDVTKLEDGEAMPACVTNLKGKLEGHLFISNTPGGGSLLMDAPGELRESLFARLSKYIIADDAELEDVTDDFVLVHDLGEGGGGLECSRLAMAGRDRWRAKGELEAGNDWLAADEAERIRIERGVPKWGAELTNDTLPAEALLDRTSVDFHKGCYVGQEVISRIQSVGRVNRQLTGLTFPDGVPAAGWQLLGAGGEKVGEVTSVSPVGDGAIGLGFLKRDKSASSAAEAGTGGENGLSCRVEIRDTPFTTQP